MNKPTTSSVRKNIQILKRYQCLTYLKSFGNVIFVFNKLVVEDFIKGCSYIHKLRIPKLIEMFMIISWISFFVALNNFLIWFNNLLFAMSRLVCEHFISIFCIKWLMTKRDMSQSIEMFALNTFQTYLRNNNIGFVKFHYSKIEFYFLSSWLFAFVKENLDFLYCYGDEKQVVCEVNCFKLWSKSLVGNKRHSLKQFKRIYCPKKWSGRVAVIKKFTIIKMYFTRGILLLNFDEFLK